MLLNRQFALVRASERGNSYAKIRRVKEPSRVRTPLYTLLSNPQHAMLLLRKQQKVQQNFFGFLLWGKEKLTSIVSLENYLHCAAAYIAKDTGSISVLEFFLFSSFLHLLLLFVQNTKQSKLFRVISVKS